MRGPLGSLACENSARTDESASPIAFYRALRINRMHALCQAAPGLPAECACPFNSLLAKCLTTEITVGFRCGGGRRWGHLLSHRVGAFFRLGNGTASGS